MSLTPLNKDLVLRPFGLQNSGAICYFNTMLQCFISCTSVLQVFDANPDGLRTRNELCAAIWQMITWARAASGAARDKKLSATSITVWKALQRQLRIMSITPFGGGMEDTHEGFTKFLDAFDAPEIEELFESRRKVSMRCSACDKTRVLTDNTGRVNQDIQACVAFSLDEFKRVGDLQQMLMSMDSDTDDNFLCSSCQKRAVHHKTERLIFAPEVIVVLFKKYEWTAEGARKQNWAADVSTRLSIPGTCGEIAYRLVAMSEHSGSTEGGHYWAHALRRDDQVLGMHRLDDNSTQPVTAAGTMSTYMVWYHHVA